MFGRPRLRARVVIEEAERGVLLKDPVTGHMAFLNPMAAAIADLCDGTRSLRGVTRDLAAATGRQPKTISREVNQTVLKLADADIVEWLPPAAPVQEDVAGESDGRY